MTTRQFITKKFLNREDGKCSSVFSENGNVYSYGYHYPLLFRVGGKVIRNVRGYSSTTQRHIAWSYGIDAIDIHTSSDFRLIGSDDEILEKLKIAQISYCHSLKDKLSAKKRKETQVYKYLEQDYQRALDNLVELTA